jgi:hypothetical protein
LTTKELTPQDKEINHSPIIQAWELYEYANGIYAHKQDWIPWFHLKNAYAVYFEFKGKSATYCLCSHDNNITRGMALEWAKNHHAGRFQTITIDLAPLNDFGKRKR